MNLHPKPIFQEDCQVSLKKNELKDSVSNTLHIDEYNAKMGDDADVSVLSLKCRYRDQANDLVNFVEKGYDWVLDADVSSGEMEDGEYLVFIEVLRRPMLPDRILKMLTDLENLTGIEASKNDFRYFKDATYLPVTLENLKAKIPLSPREYRKFIKKKNAEDVALENMQMQAGLTPANTKAPTAEDIELKNFVNLSKP